MPLLTKSRCLWEDRFSRPTAETLLGEIPKPGVTLIEGLREGLLAGGTLTEGLSWQGIPWRWSLTYADGRRLVSYIVPNPVRPVVCIPIPTGLLGSLPPRKISKTVRDAVTSSPTVAGTNWVQFDLSSKTLADELLLLVQIVRDHALTAAV